MNEIIKCKCGIVGIWNKTKEDVDFPNILDKLQHRGRESAGMTYLDENSNFQSKKDIGLVNEVFKNDKSINSKGIIGHVRYSTSGNSKLSYEDSLNEIQPFTNEIFSLAHNGNIPNIKNHDTTYIKRFI